MSAEKIIGIIGAMPEEIEGILKLLDYKSVEVIGLREYYIGKINNIKTIVVFSRWGKVAVATTATTLIVHFNVSEIFFTGVAGAISKNLNIGDIVIGKRLINHDLNCSPIINEFEIPLLKKTFIEAGEKQLDISLKAIKKFIEQWSFRLNNTNQYANLFSAHTPKCLIGDIASGDRFIATHSERDLIATKLPTVLCVEMEGAAVAQVCYEYSIPFTIIRTISDTADSNSYTDFAKFIANIYNYYSSEIVFNIFNLL